MAKHLLKVQERFGQSHVLFKSDSQKALFVGIDAVRRNRVELETYISLHHSFVEALYPVAVEDNAPRVIRIMAEAASKANVGPMAAVAGALADLAVEAICEAGARTAIVEDGGEVSAVAEEAFIVALHAGESAVGSGLGFRISPSDCPIGIATSSATVSHAVSFGEADAATVFADTAALADAAATAVCNAVVGKDVEASIIAGLEAARRMSFIRGALVVRKDFIGSVGWVPPLVNLEEG